MKKSRIVGIAVTSILIALLCLTSIATAVPQSAYAKGKPPFPTPPTPTIPLPTVTGPIAETDTSYAFDPAAGTDYQSQGYIQEEYFISGTANEYELVNPDNTSSFDVQVRTADLPYTTRILVRRPANPRHTSGNVIVEFLNPSGGYDIATAWSCYWNQIIRNRDIWVGVTCKKTIVFSTCAGWPQGLKVFDPARYAPLSFERDRAQAWDIFTQLGALLKSNDASNPLRKCRVKYLYGHGYSQTGGYLITYINFFHKDAKLGHGKPVYDGYLANSAAGPIWINDDGMNPCVPSLSFGPYPATDPRRVIQPCGVPVIHTLTETEIAIPSADLNAIVTRRADSNKYPDLFRHYEIAGACHKGANPVGPTAADLTKTMGYVCPWCCYGTISDFPAQYIHNGILDNIEKWVRLGIPPPKGDLIEVTSAGVIVRDVFGNAQGGIRTPYLDVPIKTYLPMSAACPTCPPATLCAGCSLWCVILGNMVPFDQATLEGLYENHGDYVSKFARATSKLFKGRWISAIDMGLMIKEAAQSDVLK